MHKNNYQCFLQRCDEGTNNQNVSLVLFEHATQMSF